jgi:hypothetical protein
VRHIGAVESFAFHDERLGPDALLGGCDQHGEAQHILLGRVVEPRVVHDGDPVSRAEDHVDESVGRPHLGQPVREHELGFVSRRRAYLEQTVHVGGPEEDVEVLGRAVDASLVHEGERPAHQEGNITASQDLHRLPVEGARGGFDQGLGRREGHGAAPWIG